MAIPREPQTLNVVQWAVRTAVFCIFYAGQSVVINFSQFVGLLLWPFQNYFHNYIIHTQKCYGILLVAINHFFAPSNFVITTDKSTKGIIKQTWNGAKVEINMPERLILIANHQIYADWIYIWVFAYLTGAHGAIKIILKDSLKWLPIFGWGMQFFDFIFLKRNWILDRGPLSRTLNRLAVSKDPLWLLIFPEGTLVSEATRKTSRNYAEKTGLVDHEYILLPRSTGLHFCSQTLKRSVHDIYDLTIGLEGISRGQYPEDIYTLRKIYFEGKYPRNVHIHIRHYSISEIPDDEDKFTEWLRQRWIEKDALMNEFYTRGRFPSSDSHRIKIPMRLNSVNELAYIWYFVIPLIWLIWNFSNVFIEKVEKFAHHLM